jgi:hypothetical protein
VDNEPLLEVESSDIAPCKVDFVAKYDSSCDPSSNLIWPADGNTLSPKNLMFSSNNLCAKIVRYEENLYFPENGENNFLESEITDAEVGANPVGSTGNDSGSKCITCSFNGEYINDQSEESLYSLENSQGSLHEDRITDLESNISPATITGKTPTGVDICSFEEGCVNDVDSGENSYLSESPLNSSLQSEIMEVHDGPSAVAITESIQHGKDLISSCYEVCTGDVESDGDLYSREDSQNTLHGRELTEAQSDVTPVTEISPGGEDVTPSNEQSENNSRNEDKVSSPENCLINLEKSENVNLEASKTAFMLTDAATVDALADAHTGNESSDNYGFLSEQVPDLLDTTNLRSSEGQLESIVYSAISTSNCLYNNKDDASTSVHGVLISQIENSETDSNYTNGAATNFDEVFQGSNQVQSTEETDNEIIGFLKLSDNSEKQQSTVTDNEGTRLKENKDDERISRMHAPIKLFSNRTVCLLSFFLFFFFVLYFSRY